MVDCFFDAVFLGIETPDEESLQLTKKFQNTRNSLVDSIDKLLKIGLRPIAGFIIGFDGEKKGAGDRIIQFAELTAIPTTTFAMLQALPNTALWHRLDRENRLRAEKDGNINQTTLMNFIPTRPLEDIANEYVHAFWQLYDPHLYHPPAKLPSLIDIKALAIVIWRQGVKRDTRWRFWHHLFGIIRHNPAVFEHYLTLCAHNEHFMEYRQIVRDEIEAQLAEYLSQDYQRQTLPAKQEALVS